ncbi:ABC transporter permease [bacterium]|nr:ABC transporter permease [bacterium]
MEFTAGLFDATTRILIPILLVVLGEIVSERGGVLNIGLEGMILVGAFGAFAGAWASGSEWVGLAVGVGASVTLAFVFSWLVLNVRLDAIVTGVAVNILALGLTGVLFRAFTADASGTVFTETFPPLAIPLLSELPLLGRALFAQNAIGYAAFALTGAVAFALGRTSPGLLLRAAGENPDALHHAGVDVVRVRRLAVLFGGAMAGMAGAYLATGYSNTFVENMSAGRGFVALAIVVFARWRPWAGLGGALLFAFTMALQVRLQGQSLLGVEIPYPFFQMLPYALTLVVLAVASRPSGGAPAALGRPFARER